MAASQPDHPAWDVYNLFRTARLNVKYYSVLATRARQMTVTMDAVLAVAAPGSAVAGIWFWQTPLGEVAWHTLAALAALVAVLKPFLKLPESLQQYEKIVCGYRALEHDLSTLTITIRQDRAYGPAHRAQLEEAQRRKGHLVSEAPTGRVHNRLRKRCRTEVEKELPGETFYLPPQEVGD